MQANHLAEIGTPEIGFLIFAGLAAIPLFSIVHRTLDRICFAHVMRYCRAHDIVVSGWRLNPAVDSSGIKTENTQIEVLSNDSEGAGKVYRFIVWVFGIRKVTVSPLNRGCGREH